MCRLTLVWCLSHFQTLLDLDQEHQLLSEVDVDFRDNYC